MQLGVPELVEALGRPEAYPHDESARAGVTCVQTHLSVVFLTGARVYKFRKPVSLPFVDFSTRAERNRDCLREVRLNRRLAADVYLGVAALTGARGRIAVGPTREALVGPAEGGEVPEHCVVMRRLPAGTDALSRLRRGELGEEHLAHAARVLAEFHATARFSRPPLRAAEWLEHVEAPVRANFEVLSEVDLPGIDRAEVARIEAAARRHFAEIADALEARRVSGRIVDGHGDLHLEHLWFESGPERPIFIDCIEFSENLRILDTASEVAFLAMDLEYRERGDLAAFFLSEYASRADDYPLFSVVDYYLSYRAAVRAKVEALAAGDPSIEAPQREAASQSARRHLELAARALRPRGRGVVVATCGPIGTGKSSVARELVRRLRGVRIASDPLRKRLAGLSPEARAGAEFGRGIYTPEWSCRVYRGLVERARPVVESGRVAVLDATFATRRRREELRRALEELDVPGILVEIRCPREVALARLVRRQAEGRDPSDAGPELFEKSAAAFEEPREWPTGSRAVVDTSAPDWRERAGELAERIASLLSGGAPRARVEGAR